jgi:alkylated DNA repair dioxygenase AlkB
MTPALQSLQAERLKRNRLPGGHRPRQSPEPYDDTLPPRAASIEQVFYQGSLLAGDAPSVPTDSDARIQRLHLDERSWIDHCPGWLRGADTVFDHLVTTLPWRQRTDIAMYDRRVDEPRLTYWWHAFGTDPVPLPVLGDIRRVLGRRYAKPFDAIGFNLYRDGNDSVAWHGDRHRHHVVDPIVAIVSVGQPRPLRVRPRGGGPGRSWSLGHGDLFVMGGRCQHDWEHTVPKVAHAGPRMSITYRHGAR